MQYQKTCSGCGIHFTTTNHRVRFCKKPHPYICENCNIEFFTDGPRRLTCSKKCQLEQTHKKRNITIKTDESKRRMSEAARRPETIKKRKEATLKTLSEKYGDKITNPAQIEYVKQKIKETNREKYGVEYPLQSKEIQKKIKENNLLKYGVENPGGLVSTKKKIISTNRKRYKVDYNTQTLEHRRLSRQRKLLKPMAHEEEWENLKEFLENNPNKNTHELSRYFNIRHETIRNKIRELHLENQVIDFYSYSNPELIIKSILDKANVKYMPHDRVLIAPFELDFYIPDLKLAIEVSPTITHNSLKGFKGSDPKSPYYHKNKFIECSKRGVELITVFDWHPWDNIVELLVSKLNNTNRRIFARKTEYLESDTITRDLFDKLSSWHTLSLPKNFKRKNEVSILSENNEIVGLALWTDTKTQGTKELKRMVFRPGYSIIGGPSKILKNYLINHNEVMKVITFSDCDLGQGLTYEKIGFELIEESKPTLTYWSDKYKMKVKYTSLVMQGADRLLRKIPDYKKVGLGDDLPSNADIVLSYGFLPVYDCGYRKWEYIKEKK